MADHLEKTCPFYSNIGACRRGDRCFHLHNSPTLSPTLLLTNMYQHPDADTQQQPIDPRKLQEHFEDFYEDIFEELSKFGEIECLNVCDNLAQHMVGNVFVMFKYEEQAAAALQAFRRRAYCGRKIIVDFSPVTDFREAICKRFEENGCSRGSSCNFIHVKQIGRGLRRRLFGKYHSESRRSRSRSRSRSVSPYYQTRADRRGGDYSDRGDYYGNERPSADRHGRYDGLRGRQRNWSPRRTRCPVREGSEERRAKIEQWNREKEREREREGRR